MSQIFKKNFQTGDINFFVHCGALSVAQFQTKSSYSNEQNTQAGI